MSKTDRCKSPRAKIKSRAVSLGRRINASSIFQAPAVTRKFGSKLFEISYPGGESRRLTSDLTHYSHLTITADGKTVVAVENEWSAGVWVSPNADLALAVQILSSIHICRCHDAWRPDKRIVYISSASGNKEVWIQTF